jgi:hypothetical protein
MDSISLLQLRPARTDPDIVAMGQAIVAHHYGVIRIRVLASLPTLPPVADIVLLAPLAKSGPDIAALLQPFGNVPAATTAQIVQLANVANADILQLAGLAQVHTVAEVIQLAQAGGRPLADIIALATNAPGLSVNHLLQLAPIAKSVPDILVLLSPFGGVPAATAAQIVQLANVANAEILQLGGLPQVHTVAEVIQLAQAGGRPRADLITLGTNVAGLTVGEMVALAAVPAGGTQLGEAFVTRARAGNFNAADWVNDAHARPLNERQSVLISNPLLALVRAGIPGRASVTVMSALLERSQQWENPPDSDFFDHFITRRRNSPLANTRTMNCWESILYAAFLAQQIDAAWIRQFYRTALAAGDPNVAIWAALGYIPGLLQYPASMPTAGQLLFFTGSTDPYPGHVALSLGGHKMMTLWHQPNNIDSVQRIRINTLVNDPLYGVSPPVVTFVNPPW